jgi:dihydropteroate synthase
VLGDVVALGTPVSIDSMKSAVVAWALDAGAAIANDVWGLQRDPDMARVVAEHRVPVIVMHNRDRADAGIDIMQDIAAFFARSLDIAARAGIAESQIVLDPGIGFGKTGAHNLQLLARLGELRRLGRPVCLGVSRKGFLGQLLGRPAGQRLAGSLAAACFALAGGAAHIIRAHDVAETRDAVAVFEALGRRARPPGVTGTQEEALS